MNFKTLENVLIILTLLILPFAFISEGLGSVGQQTFFVLIAVLFAIIRTKNIWLCLFALYAVCWELVICVGFVAGFFNPIQHMTSIGLLVFLLAASTIYSIIVDSKIKKETIFNFICIATILQCVLAIFQFRGFDPVFLLLNNLTEVVREFNGVTGSLGNPNFLAAFIAISTPFFFRKWWFFFLPVIYYVLYLAQTATAIIALIVGTAVFFSGRSYYLNAMLVIIVGITCFAGVMLKTSSFAVRLDIWKEAVVPILTSWKGWIFGGGPGIEWKGNFPIHNDFLEIFRQYGLIGLGLVFSYLASLKRGNRILLSAAVVCLVDMLGNYPIQLAPSGYLFILIFGLIERRRLYGI